MNSFPRTQILSKDQRRLLLLMQDIRYGRIEGLSVRDGNPIFSESTKVIRYVKFSDTGVDSQIIQRRDLLDKPQVIDLLGFIAGLSEGHLESLEIQDGLPFKMSVMEKLHTQ